MLSKLEQFTKACVKLEKRGIVVQEERCLRNRHLHSSCQYCLAVCPHEAIHCGEGLTLLAGKCTGCGACAAVCPGGALVVKLPSNAELCSLITLHVKHSGAVAFACEDYLKTHPEERQRAIAVHCTARCDEAVLIYAVLQGAAGVSIVNAACPDCPQHKLSGLVQSMADTANRLLAGCNYPAVIALIREIPVIIKPLPGTGGTVTGMSRRAFLTAFKNQTASLLTQVLPEMAVAEADKRQDNNVLQNPMGEAKFLPDKWCSLASSLEKLKNTAYSTVLDSKLWGDIAISDNCNGCGVCAEACPTAAIAIGQQAGSWSISFHTSRCTQCGLCQDVCFRESIKVHSRVKLGDIVGRKPRVIIEKKQAEIAAMTESLDQRMARLLGCVVKS